MVGSDCIRMPFLHHLVRDEYIRLSHDRLARTPDGQMLVIERKCMWCQYVFKIELYVHRDKYKLLRQRLCGSEVGLHHLCMTYRLEHAHRTRRLQMELVQRLSGSTPWVMDACTWFTSSPLRIRFL